MSGKAIVVREHVMTVSHRGQFCRYCGLSDPNVMCEPRLAAVPAGWTGETVEVDENTANYLEGRKPAVSQAAQLAEIQHVFADGKPGASAPMTFCEKCHTYILAANYQSHCLELHP
jgi:hypothetical protein